MLFAPPITIPGYAPVLNPIQVFWPIGTSETAAKKLHLVLVSVSDCKRLETRSPWLRAWFNTFK